MTTLFKELSSMAALAVCLCGCGGVSKTAEPTAIAELSFSGQPGAEDGTTVGFVAEDVIAIGRVSGAVTAVQWKDGKLSAPKTVWIPGPNALDAGLFPAGEGQFISTIGPPQVLSSDLTTLAKIPTKFVIPPVGRSSVAGGVVPNSRGDGGWNVYRLAPAMGLLRNGPGQLLSVSEDTVVFRLGDDIKVETMNGQRLGSFAISPRTTCAPISSLLGPNRLYLNGCAHPTVVDFSGKTITRVPTPDGWGFRYGVSADGRRMLFDNYTRRISVWRQIIEFGQDVITLGYGFGEITSKGEIVRVVDTETGKICFDLDDPDHQLRRPGEYHADISPSGRFVAVASKDKLSVYQLPAVCGQ